MSTIYFGCVDLAIEPLVLTVVDIIVEVIIASALAVPNLQSENNLLFLTGLITFINSQFRRL